MMINYGEGDGLFYIDFVAETAEDASFLARLSINHLRVVPDIQVDAYADGKFTGIVYFNKKAESRSEIK